MILCCFRIRVSVKPWGCSCNYHFHMLEIKRLKFLPVMYATYYVEYNTHINHQRKFQTNPTINLLKKEIKPRVMQNLIQEQ